MRTWEVSLIKSQNSGGRATLKSSCFFMQPSSSSPFSTASWPSPSSSTSCLDSPLTAPPTRPVPMKWSSSTLSSLSAVPISTSTQRSCSGDQTHHPITLRGHSNSRSAQDFQDLQLWLLTFLSTFLPPIILVLALAGHTIGFALHVAFWASANYLVVFFIGICKQLLFGFICSLVHRNVFAINVVTWMSPES